MDADKIRLPGFLIADLYKSCLVDTDAFLKNSQTSGEGALLSDEKTSSFKIKYLGENRKNVIIVVNQPDLIYLNNEDLAFLTNILKACMLGIADIAIINTAEQQVTFTAIKEQFSALQIVLFNVEPSFIKLPFIIPPFQVQKYDGTAVIAAPALSVLNKPDNEGRILKTKLWNSLKQVFDI